VRLYVLYGYCDDVQRIEGIIEPCSIRKIAGLGVVHFASVFFVVHVVTTDLN
jgi:hypothetical protein